MQITRNALIFILLSGFSCRRPHFEWLLQQRIFFGYFQFKLSKTTFWVVITTCVSTIMQYFKLSKTTFWVVITTHRCRQLTLYVVEDHILSGYYNEFHFCYFTIWVVEDHILSGYYNVNTRTSLIRWLSKTTFWVVITTWGAKIKIPSLVVEDHILSGYYNDCVKNDNWIYVVEDHILSGYYNKILLLFGYVFPRTY